MGKQAYSVILIQKDLPQIIIVMGGVLHHVKVLSALIRTTLKIFQKNCPSVEKNQFEIFEV